MRWGAVLFAIALMGGGAGAASAAEAPSLAAQLGGKTLSAVVYVPRNAANGGGSLQRLVLQAYLEADGRALVRQWQSADNRYSAAARTRWSLTDDKLCIELSAAPICAKVHIWGPRIAGIGTRPYAMLDGDLQPGNAIAGGR